MATAILANDLLLLKKSNSWQDIKHVLARAFEGQPILNNLLDKLNSLANQYRKTKDKRSAFLLLDAYKKSCWSVKNRFAQDPANQDIKDLLYTDTESTEFNKALFDDFFNNGKQFLKSLGAKDEVMREINNNFENIAKLSNEISMLEKTKEEKIEQEFLEFKENNTLSLKYSELSKELKKLKKNSIEWMRSKEHMENIKNELEKAVNEKRFELKRTGGKYAQEEHAKLERLEKSRAENRKNIQKNIAEIHKKIISGLLDSSPVSEREALEWVENNINMDRAFIDYARRNNISRDRVKQQLALIYRISKGKFIRPINLSHTRGTRSCAWNGARILDLRNNSESTLFHEVGHFLEFDNSAVKQSAGFFIRKNATGKPAREGIANGIADEQTFPGNFSDPYIGKIYRDGATEVISMGLQFFESDRGLSTGIEDLEHIFFCIGVLSSEKYEQFLSDSTSFNSNEYYALATQDRNFSNSIYVSSIKSTISKKVKDAMLSTGIDGISIEIDTTRTFPTDSGESHFCYVVSNGKRLTMEGSWRTLDECLLIAYLLVCYMRKLLPDSFSGDATSLLSHIQKHRMTNNSPWWYTADYVFPEVV